MKHSGFYFVNEKSATEVDILIYGIIGNSFWNEDSVGAKQFVNEFKELEQKYDRINIRINSPGGSVNEGLPICNAISSSKAETHTYIDGIAYSMGAMIALSADTVHSAKNGLLLLHNASGLAWGNAQQLRDTASMLDKYDSSLITTISDKTGKEEQQIRSLWFDYKDHLFTASEAKSQGLIDVIEDSKADVPSDIKDMTMEEIFNHFQKENPHKEDSFPGDFINKLRSLFSTSNSNQKNSDMEILNTISKALGLETENPTVDNVVDEITSLRGQVTDLTNQVNDHQSLTEDFNSVIDGMDQIDESIANAEGHQAKIQALNAHIEDLANEDAADETRPPKEKDRITEDDDPSDSFDYNKKADQFLG